MQKSIEERLADIESNIARLTEMQGCIFRLLLILRKTVHLFEARVATSTSIIASLESQRQGGNYFLALMFGAITVVGVAASMLALYFATQNSAFILISMVLFVLFFILLIFGFLEYRRINSQLREAKKEATQAKEVIDAAREKGASLDEALARVLAEWKELVPDDLVSEPKSED